MGVREKARFWIFWVIIGLVLSGLTAFPLLHELNVLASLVDADSGLGSWIHRVRDGLAATHEAYPFIAYGTDWLAFGHLVIAMFFVLPFRDPERYVGVLWVGLIASVAVIPLAMICGPIREIPLGWRLIDCSFGVICCVPLWLALREVRRMEVAGMDFVEAVG